MCRSMPAAPHARNLIWVLAAALLCLTGGTASPKENALAQRVKQEAQVLHKEVQDMISTKQFDRAISILRAKGSTWLREFGAKSWPMAEVSSNLADAYLACGSACDKEEDAAELYEKAAVVKLEIHGQEHPEYAAAIEKAADALIKVGAYKRALPYFKKLEKKVSAGLGEEHAAVRNVRVKLGDCAMQAKSYKTAKHIFMRLLQNSAGAEDEAKVRLQLAVALTHLGDGQTALGHIDAAKELITRHFGKQHIWYAKVLNGAAGVFERLARDADAIRSMREASDIIAKLLGADDPMAVQARRNTEGLQNAIRAKNSNMKGAV